MCWENPPQMEGFLFAGKMIELWHYGWGIFPKKIAGSGVLAIAMVESWPATINSICPQKAVSENQKIHETWPNPSKKFPRSFQEVSRKIWSHPSTPITPITPSSHLPRSTALPPPAPHGARPRSDAPRDFRDFD